MLQFRHEVAIEAGYIKGARKTLKLLGVIGGGAVGAAVGAAVAGPVGAVLAGSAGSAFGYLTEIASKLGANWKPVIFGDWLRDRIEKIVGDHDEQSR